MMEEKEGKTEVGERAERRYGMERGRQRRKEKRLRRRERRMWGKDRRQNREKKQDSRKGGG